MTDKVWPNHETGPNELETRSDLEQQDVNSLQRELDEQERISRNTGGVFDHNRVPVERKPS